MQQNAERLVRSLCEQGEGIALINAADIRMTGELLSSITSDTYGTHGVVACDCDYAVFVEFGTGIVGSRNQHPDIAILGWSYDVNGHGELGWWYPTDDADTNPTKKRAKNGQFVAWTKGLPSRPFMYETAQKLKELVIPTAKEVFL